MDQAAVVAGRVAADAPAASPVVGVAAAVPMVEAVVVEVPWEVRSAAARVAAVAEVLSPSCRRRGRSRRADVTRAGSLPAWESARSGSARSSTPRVQSSQVPCAGRRRDRSRHHVPSRASDYAPSGMSPQYQPPRSDAALAIIPSAGGWCAANRSCVSANIGRRTWAPSGRRPHVHSGRSEATAGRMRVTAGATVQKRSKTPFLLISCDVERVPVTRLRRELVHRTVRNRWYPLLHQGVGKQPACRRFTSCRQISIGRRQRRYGPRGGRHAEPPAREVRG